jgi:hypothetical protein
VVNATPQPLYPLARDPVPVVQEAAWAQGPVWTGAENIVSTGIRSPGRPARIQAHLCELLRISIHYLCQITVTYAFHVTASIFRVPDCNYNYIVNVTDALKHHTHTHTRARTHTHVGRPMCCLKAICKLLNKLKQTARPCTTHSVS